METQSDYTQVVNFSLYKTTFSKGWRHILYIKLYISYKLKFHWIWNEWKKNLKSSINVQMVIKLYIDIEEQKKMFAQVL